MDFAVAKICNVPINLLSTVPIYRRRQAEIIAVARHRARPVVAKRHKCGLSDVQFFGE